jgi:hypothetical protein
MKFIQFGSENGSTQAGNTIRPLQVKLNSLFYKSNEEGSYFKNFNFLSIVFRVSGKNKDFNFEGAERLQKSSGRKALTIDYSIPEYRWKQASPKEFGTYVGEGVKSCFAQLRNELIKLDDVERLLEIDNRFKIGMENFGAFVNTLDDNA